MKIIPFFLFLVFAFFTKGFALEKLVFEFRVDVDPAKITISKEGFFLESEDYGHVFLDNLHQNEERYYTICKCALFCTNCHKKFGISPKICNFCGSASLVVVGIEMNRENELLSVQDLLCAYLTEAPLWEEKILLCGELTASVGVDNEGNQSAKLKIENESDDGNVRGGVTGTVKKDDRGDVTYTVEAEIKVGF